MEIIKARERKQKLTKCIYSLDKKCCLNEETKRNRKGNDAREKKKHKMLKKKPLLQQTFLLCLYLEKQPFLLLLFQCISFKDNRENEYFSPSFDRVVERRASLLTSSKRQGSCSQLSVMSAAPKVIDLLCNHRFRLGWAVVSFFSMYFYSSEMRYGMFI